MITILINKKYNVIVKKNMNKIAIFKNKNNNCYIKIKNLNNQLIYNFKIIKEVTLSSLTNKAEREFV